MNAVRLTSMASASPPGLPRRAMLAAGLGISIAMLLIAGCAINTWATAINDPQNGVKPSKMGKLVIQVSDADPAKWNLALNNAKNVQDELGAGQAEIEIVAYGPGIGMLKLESVANSRVTDAIKSGVKIVACENTMRAQKLVQADMHPAIAYVPAGVTEIMRKQAQGWAYLRP